MQVQRPRTRNTENVAYENRSDPCGCWCTWYGEKGYGRKHQESIRESYYDRDSKDLRAGICANRQKGAQCMNRMIDLSDSRCRCMVCARLMHKKNTSKDCDKRDNSNNNNNNSNNNNNKTNKRLHKAS